MQALSKLSSYVCNKSFVIFPTVMNSLSVGVFSCERIAAQFPPLWRKILLRRGQRKVRLSEGRPSGNVSPFSSSSRGIKHIFRAYPSTLKIAEPCFETTAAHSTIIWSARLGFLPPREAGTGFVGVLPLPSTHFWSSRWENNTLYTETTLKIAFAILSRNQSPDVSNLERGRSCE